MMLRIYGSVLVAELPHDAAPSIYHMICYVLFVRDLYVWCFVCVFQFVISASKFSRSPYLDNHLSESIHTWPIGTP